DLGAKDLLDLCKAADFGIDLEQSRHGILINTNEQKRRRLVEIAGDGGGRIGTEFRTTQTIDDVCYRPGLGYRLQCRQLIEYRLLLSLAFLNGTARPSKLSREVVGSLEEERALVSH